MESFGAYKQNDARSASNARGQRILESKAYHVGRQYQVGMLWADEKCSLPKNYFSVHLKSLERRLVEN